MGSQDEEITEAGGSSENGVSSCCLQDWVLERLRLRDHQNDGDACVMEVRRLFDVSGGEKYQGGCWWERTKCHARKHMMMMMMPSVLICVVV